MHHHRRGYPQSRGHSYSRTSHSRPSFKGRVREREKERERSEMTGVLIDNNKCYVAPMIENGKVKDGVPSNRYSRQSATTKDGYTFYYDVIDVSLKPLMKDKRVGIIIRFSTAELLVVEYLSSTPFYGWTTKHLMSYLGYYCNEEKGYYQKCCLMKNTSHTYNSGEKCIFYHLHGKRLPEIDDVSYRQYIKEFKEWYEVSYAVPEPVSAVVVPPSPPPLPDITQRSFSDVARVSYDKVEKEVEKEEKKDEPDGFQNPDGTYRKSFLLDIPTETEYVFSVFTAITPPPGLSSFKFIKPSGEQVTDLFPVGTVESPALCNMIIPPAPTQVEYSWYVR